MRAQILISLALFLSACGGSSETIEAPCLTREGAVPHLEGWEFEVPDLDPFKVASVQVFVCRRTWCEDVTLNADVQVWPGLVSITPFVCLNHDPGASVRITVSYF